jgi:peptidoglycan/LPS O-acetylase OafA/YrhL
VNTFFAGLLLLFMMVGSGSRKGLVNSSVLQFFGYISYGLYLIHLLVFQIYDILTRKFWPWLQPSVGHFDLILLRFAIVSATAVGLAYVSRKYYEEWFLRLKDRIAVPPAEKPAETSVKVLVTASAASATPSEASESF